MSGTVDPFSSQRASLKMAWGNLSQAMLILSQAHSQTTDPQLLNLITNTYITINSYAHLIQQAYMQTDNNLFVQETSFLKTQAQSLISLQNQILTITQSVAIVAQVVGFVAQAVSIVAAL